MGKFNRPSRTRKLQKLTDDLIVGVVSIEIKEKMKKLIEPQPTEVTTKKKDKKKDQTTKKVSNQDITPHGVEATITSTTEEVQKMNVYQKVQEVRSAIAKYDIQKTGSNEDKGFKYFELTDYLPMLNKLMATIGLMTKFDMTNEKGTLKIFNTAKPEEVLEFELPTADLEMADHEGNKAEGIQIMGGKTTYMRRYLMQIAFEISVKDTVDSRPAKQEVQEELEEEDIKAIQEANGIEHLNTICQHIRARKGFTNNRALLRYYTQAKEGLEK